MYHNACRNSETTIQYLVHPRNRINDDILTLDRAGKYNTRGYVRNAPNVEQLEKTVVAASILIAWLME